MTGTFRNHWGRGFTVGALTTALVVSGAASGVAFASAPTQHSGTAISAATSTSSPSASPSTSSTASTHPKITIKVIPTTTIVNTIVTVSGTTKNLPEGSTVQLQHKVNNKWTSLKAKTTVKVGGLYSLTTKFSSKGTQHLRVKDGKAHSPTVKVTVH